MPRRLPALAGCAIMAHISTLSSARRVGISMAQPCVNATETKKADTALTMATRQRSAPLPLRYAAAVRPAPSMVPLAVLAAGYGAFKAPGQLSFSHNNSDRRACLIGISQSQGGVGLPVASHRRAPVSGSSGQIVSGNVPPLRWRPTGSGDGGVLAASGGNGT